MIINIREIQIFYFLIPVNISDMFLEEDAFSIKLLYVFSYKMREL